MRPCPSTMHESSPSPGKTGSQQLLKKPLWKFRQYGESGRWVSDLFPETARHSDKLCLLHSMHTEGVAHGPATLFLHCGSTNFVRPSMGAWINYGLGSENENLPGFVSICPSPGNGGARNYGSAFLPRFSREQPWEQPAVRPLTQRSATWSMPGCPDNNNGNSSTC
ncbi:MAG: hypothetical protein CM1200mP2_15780 [Planctomycetaceae bacterium]|nr:MAG: hypothetical protein CM1200mP2_15780 [Planctomycetaceae bacterium]